MVHCRPQHEPYTSTVLKVAETKINTNSWGVNVLVGERTPEIGLQAWLPKHVVHVFFSPNNTEYAARHWLQHPSLLGCIYGICSWGYLRYVHFIYVCVLAHAAIYLCFHRQAKFWRSGFQSAALFSLAMSTLLWTVRTCIIVFCVYYRNATSLFCTCRYFPLQCSCCHLHCFLTKMLPTLSLLTLVGWVSVIFTMHYDRFGSINALLPWCLHSQSRRTGFRWLWATWLALWWLLFLIGEYARACCFPFTL